MRLVLFAAVAGFSLALGLIGLYVQPANSSDSPGFAFAEADNAVVGTLPPAHGAGRIVASHSDATTEDLHMGLNSNLIRGESTLICTADMSLADSVTVAARIWNERLSPMLPRRRPANTSANRCLRIALRRSTWCSGRTCRGETGHLHAFYGKRLLCSNTGLRQRSSSPDFSTSRFSQSRCGGDSLCTFRRASINART